MNAVDAERILSAHFSNAASCKGSCAGSGSQPAAVAKFVEVRCPNSLRGGAPGPHLRAGARAQMPATRTDPNFVYFKIQ